MRLCADMLQLYTMFMIRSPGLGTVKIIFSGQKLEISGLNKNIITKYLKQLMALETCTNGCVILNVTFSNSHTIHRVRKKRGQSFFCITLTNLDPVS